MTLSLATRPSRLNADPFVLSLVGVVCTATFLPSRGPLAEVFHGVGIFAISSLFFLQGARLSRDAVLNGMTHWRLHATIGTITFVLFPSIGLGLVTLVPQLLPQPLWLGVLFVCALPSTVQSSIALTSIAQGNVAGAVCSATASNLAGIVLAPLIFGAVSRLHGGAIAVGNIGQILLELVVPFAVGHLLRPWIGHWAERNRQILAVTDRGSILLVVYTAFSAAVVNGVWHQLPPLTMALLGLVVAVLLAVTLLSISIAAHLLGFSKPDEIAIMFCRSQKSLVSGVPIANVLFQRSVAGPILIPIMVYYPLQLVVCGWLARHCARETVTVLDRPFSPAQNSLTLFPSTWPRALSSRRGKHDETPMVNTVSAATIHQVARSCVGYRGREYRASQIGLKARQLRCKYQLPAQGNALRQQQ